MENKRITEEKANKDSLVSNKREKKEFYYNVQVLKNPKYKKIIGIVSHTIRANYISFKMDKMTLKVAVDIGKFILSNSNDRDTIEELNILCSCTDSNEDIVNFLKEMYSYTDRYSGRFIDQYNKEHPNKETNIPSLEIDKERIIRDKEQRKKEDIEIIKFLGLE